ncbi:MAG: hypothetical protein ABIS18_08020 [Actinomycetota bacterium]
MDTTAEGSGREPRSFGFRSRICAGLAALAIAVALVPLADASESDLRLVGYFDRRNADSVTDADGNIVIDHHLGKAFQINNDPKPALTEYSLDTLAPGRRLAIPPMVAAETRAGRVEWLTSLDPVGHRLFAFERDVDAVPENYKLFNIDLRAMTVSPSVTLWPGADRIPLAISYHPLSDRVYILTRVSNLDAAGSLLFLEERRTNGDEVWTYRLAPCFSALDQQYPPTLARSIIDPSNIYLNCYNSGGTQSQIVRVRLGPDGTVISGGEDVYAGMPRTLSTMFDPGSDRMFFLTTNSGAGRGVWVFDGLRSTFLGVIASGDTGNGALDYSMGLDPVTGRLYLHTPVGLLVSDGRRLPLGGGLLFRQYAQFGVGTIVVDPLNRRVFVPDSLTLNRNLRPARYIIVKDELAAFLPQSAGDPDSLTSDVEERPEVTRVNISAAGRSFAARTLSTGGLQRGAWNLAIGQVAPEEFELGRDGIRTVPLDDRNRDIYGARVRSVSLTNDSADAMSLMGQADEGTLKDLNQADIDWPFEVAECQDDGKKPSNGSANDGMAGASCDSAAHVAMASASAPGFPGADPSLISAKNLFAQSSVVRDPTQGLVSRSTASVYGLSLLGGKVRIGQLVSEATARAKGRPGTANATFTRTIFQLEIDQDGDGTYEFRCDVCDPAAAQENINRALVGVATISFPEPDGAYYPLGSPKGFQSVVEKDRFNFYSDRALNDDDSKEVAGAVLSFPFDARAGRSRLTVQLAAVQAEAHYGIYVIPQTLAGVPSLGTGAATFVESPTFERGAVSVMEFVPPEVTPAGPVQVVIDKIVEKIAQGARLFVSNPGDAVLFAAFWGLLILPAYLMQRRRLIGVP